MALKQFSNRLEKLEAAMPGRGPCGPVAVLEHPFPDGDAMAWACSILESLEEPAATWVLQGPERKVLLAPTRPGAMPDGGEAERVWLAASSAYPHYLIVGDGVGGLLVERFDSEAHYAARVRELAETLHG